MACPLRPQHAMTDLVEALAQGPLLADGAMGTYLKAQHPYGDEQPFETLALTDPDRVEAAHVAYLRAGSQIISTHTFRSNRVRLGPLGLAGDMAKVQQAAVRAARRAVESAGRTAFILGSLGPTGLRGSDLDQLEPVAAVFQEQAEQLADGGVDGFIVETLSDPREWLAALIGTRRAADRPLLTTISLSAEGLSRDGYTLEDFVQALIAHWEDRPEAFGLGCGAGPAPLLSHLRRLKTLLTAAERSLPLVVQPNAGMPTRRGGEVVFSTTPDYFAQNTARWLAAGANVIGACCGTTPAHVSAMHRALEAFWHEPERPGRLESQAGVAAEGPSPWEDAASAKVFCPEVIRPASFPSSPPFWMSFELDPPKGATTERMLTHAREAAQAGAHAVNLADSPMARVRMSSLASAALIERELGIPTLLHFTTRDRNLMGLQADLLGAHALGLRSLLALTGDPPGLGDYAHATAVYDLDSVGLLHLVTRLNSGFDAQSRPLAGATQFHVSAGVDPGAPDLHSMVVRTRDKIAAGAMRLLTQPIYEPDVLYRFLDALQPDVPIILGVMPLLSGRQADYLHHEVPGIRIPPLVRHAMHAAGDQGERVGLELSEELVQTVRAYIHGVYVVPSLGRVKGPLRLLRAFRSRYSDSDSKEVATRTPTEG